MAAWRKILRRVLAGNADAGLRFEELCGLLARLGFEKRVRGDHHIFTKSGVVEILNLHPKDGFAKPYQVRQVREVIVKYQMAGNDEGDSSA